MRQAELSRKTAETDIWLSLDLDGTGKSEIETGCGFLDHMLTLFARHTVEDIGICLGDAFARALGDKRGILRYGACTLPMDEALILTAVDISGRGMLCYGLDIPTQKVGTFDSELTKEFLIAFARRSDMTVHVRQLAGENSHHIIEGAFKTLARALRTAVSIDPQFAQEIPSTKGVL